MPDTPAFTLLPPAADDGPDDALAASAELPGRDAIAAMRRAAEAHPEDPDYWFMLGSALARRGEHAAAVPAYQEALRFPTAERSYRRCLGASLLQLGRLEEARESFEAALRDEPEDADAANGLALALLRLGRPGEAVPVLRGIASPGAARAAWHSNLGAALFAAGSAAEAESSFRRALRSEPRTAAFHRNLGLALLARGKASRAAASLSEALRLDPGNAATVMDLGDALFAAGRHAEAEDTYERGVALDPRAASSRPATQTAWRQLRVERARGELGALDAGGSPWTALSRATDALLERLDDALDLLGTRAGRLAGAAAVLLLLLASGRVAFVVLPHYVAHHRLHDEVAEHSRMPTRDNGLVRDRVLDAVRRLGRERYVRPEDVQVEATDSARRVRFSYEVPVELVPGVPTRLRFRVDVDEPFFVEPPPVIF